MAWKLVVPQEKVNEPRVQGQDIAQGILRTGARTAARATESVAGLPGDVASALLGLGNYLTKGKIPQYSKVQEKLPISLPTSGQIRKFHEPYTGEYLKPQSKTEEFFDDVTSDIATLLLPIKGKVPFKSALLRALPANVASWATEKVGGGPLFQAGAKLGTFILSGLKGGRQKVENLSKSTYALAEPMAEKILFNPTKSINTADKIYEAVRKGAKTTSDEALSKPLRDFLKFAEKGKVSAKDMWDQSKKLNNIIFNANIDKNAKRQLGSIVQTINEEIKNAGKSNPEFLKLFDSARDLSRGLIESSKISQFFNKHLSLEGFLKDPITKTLLFTYFGKPGLVTLGGAFAAKEGLKAAELLVKSPTARKAYGDMITNALANNVTAVSKDLAKLDKEATRFNKQTTSPNSSWRLIS